MQMQKINTSPYPHDGRTQLQSLGTQPVTESRLVLHYDTRELFKQPTLLSSPTASPDGPPLRPSALS
jgi:hypothetical protein